MAATRSFNRGSALAALAMTAALPAAAQTALEDTVRSRFPPPEYKPIGVDLGMNDAYLLYPKLDVVVAHTDNLFRDATGRIADQLVTFAPSIDLKSDWDNHALDLAIKAEIGRYVDNAAEDYEDLEATIRGRLDVTDVDRLTLLGTAARRHQDRSAPDDVNEPEPTLYAVSSLRLTAEHDTDVAFLRAIGTAERIDFQDNGPTDNDDRDRVQLELRTRLGYEALEGSTPFVEIAANSRTFDRAIDNDGIRRGSQGYEVLIGDTLDLSGVTFLEGAVGFRRQTFDEPTFDPVSGLTFTGRATWNATDLLTLSFRLERSIEETSLTDASSVAVTQGTLIADYAPLDSVLATARLSYGQDVFDGIDRTDDRLRIDLGVQYLVGSNFVLGANVLHEDRASTTPGNGFDANEIALRFGGQL